MSDLTPKPGGSFVDRPQPEAGLHGARCFAIIHLGTQPQMHNNQPKDPAPEIMICFELPKFMHSVKEGEAPTPYPILQRYTYSSGDRAKLPGVLKAWAKATKPIDIEKLLHKFVGQYAYLTLEKTPNKKKEGKFYVNIGAGGRSISPWLADVPKPEPINKNIFFTLNLETFTWEIFKSLPPQAQKALRNSAEWSKIVAKFPEPTAAKSAQQAGNDMANTPEEDDDLPF